MLNAQFQTSSMSFENFASRELQAALSERESLLEQEERLKARIEESEKLLKSCETDSVSSSSESEEMIQGDKCKFLSRRFYFWLCGHSSQANAT